MKEYKVFSAIHQLKEKGFRRSSVAKQLGIRHCFRYMGGMSVNICVPCFRIRLPLR
jgi:hypothetical protein